MYTSTHANIHALVWMHTCVLAFIRMCTYIFIYKLYVYMYSTHIFMCVNMCDVKTVYMCTGAYAFVHTYIYMPTHVFIAVNILYFRNHVAAGRHIVIPAIICGKNMPGTGP